MAEVEIVRRGNHALFYDPDDVEDLDFKVSVDAIEVPCPGAPECGCDGSTLHRVTGQHHVTVRIDFKPGKRATWRSVSG